MRKLMTAVLCVPLIAATAMPAVGQGNRGSNGQYQQRNDWRYSHHDHFDRGAYEGGRGGNYGYYPRNDRYRGDYRNHEGGIGPGKGALIGGAGGAALGALFTGSAKGAIIGGAAGAGIGAILGQQAQDHRDRRYNNPY